MLMWAIACSTWSISTILMYFSAYPVTAAYDKIRFLAAR